MSGCSQHLGCFLGICTLLAVSAGRHRQPSFPLACLRLALPAFLFPSSLQKQSESGAEG